MKVATVFTLGFWICLWNIQMVEGVHDVTVRLLEYSRNKDCDCDTSLSCNDCDVFIQICLQPLSPLQGQLCKGTNSDYLVDDTYHFVFASALRGHDTYSWSRIHGQPTFKISIHAIDYDPVGANDNLGVTTFTYRSNAPLEQTVTTTPGSMNLRIRLHYIVTPPPTPKPTTTTTKRRVVTTPIKTTTTTTSTTTAIPTFPRNQSILVLGSVSTNQIQRLEEEIKKNLKQNYSNDEAAQSLSIAVPVDVFSNITSEPVTKILLKYRCTICDLEVHQVNDSVQAALQTMNLKQYEETNTGEHQVNTSKRNVGLIVGVVISVLFLIITACVILWLYKRKFQKRSKIHAEGHRSTDTGDQKPSDDTSLKQEEPCPERNDNRSN